MINALKVINKIQVETKADQVVLGVTASNIEEFVLVMKKGDFEQQNKMAINTQSTVDGIIDSFNQSYSDYCERETK